MKQKIKGRSREMDKKERQQKIIQLLQSREEVYVSTICNKFKVVPMTVRRDLSQLEKEGLIIRTHGGAILKEKGSTTVSSLLLKGSRQTRS